MTKYVVITGVLVLIGLGVWYTSPEVPQGSTPTPSESTLTASIHERVSALGVSITPLSVLEDSRCPSDVTCIQAGTVRLRAKLESGLGTATQDFRLGEPVTTEAEAVTLLSVTPGKISTEELKPSEYRFTFKIEKRAISYANASKDLIRVELPYPGAVVGKEFSVIGKARGMWFFEASFPIEVVGRNGELLDVAVAQAEGEWMTEDFVPFRAGVSVPESYIGPATIILKRDNASGLPEHDASAWYPITIEY